MFKRNQIGIAVSGCFAAAKGDGGVGGAVAALSKAQKTKVQAGIDWTKELTTLATQETAAIVEQVNLMATRMTVWFAVAKLGESKPELFKAYEGILRKRVLLSAGLTQEQVDGDRNLWPVAVQELYSRHLSKRVAETRKVMAALRDKYSDTLKVLGGKGGINAKLASLPNPTTRGRKKGRKSGPAGETAQTAKNSGKPGEKGKRGDVVGKDRLAAIAEHIGQLSTEDLHEVAEMVAANLLQRAEYKTDAHTRKFVDTLRAARTVYLTESSVETENSTKGRRAA